MNIHLLATPEYPQEEYNILLDFLQTNGQGFNFLPAAASYWEQFEKSRFYYKFGYQQRWADGYTMNFQFANTEPERANWLDTERRKPLSWREFFGLGEEYRQFLGLPDTDFVVVLTKRRNSLNWFSGIDDAERRNIFVQGSDWDIFLDCEPVFPMAYEILASVLQTLMGMGDSQKLYQIVHQRALGCMNDMCGQKSEIILKLRTADICPACVAHIKTAQIPIITVRQILQVFEKIRSQVLYSQGFMSSVEISNIQITADFKIVFPDYDGIELKLSPAVKAVYLLFLSEPHGIKFVDMPNFVKKFEAIYSDISPRSNEKKIGTTAQNVCYDIRSGFNSLRKYVGDIKTAIEKTLTIYQPQALTIYHIIGKNGEAKSIQLARTKIEFHPSTYLIR